MKKKFKILLTACLLLLAVCGAAVSVSASTYYYYYGGTIVVDPSFPNSVFDANDHIEIPFTVTRYRTTNTSNRLSQYFCDVYGPDGRRESHNYGYLSDMTSAVLNWTVFDNTTPHDLGEYTVKYYTTTSEGSTCHFYVNTVSGSFGSNIKWVFNNATGELRLSGTGNMPTPRYASDIPWYSYEESIRTIVFENGITSINEQAFWYFPNLTTVVLPETLTQIGKNVFYNCPNLKTINFPNSLTQIGDGAFNKCSSLENIVLPNGLRLLGETTFGGTAIRNIVIPSGIVKLPEHLFNDCYSLETITIPKSVKGIGYCAFSGCVSLKTVYYGGSKTEWNRIDKWLNDELESVTIVTNQPQAPTPVTLADTQLKSLTNTSSGIKVAWNKVGNAKGYYVYRKAGSGSWQQIAAIKKSITASYTDKKAANGVQYSYVVKAYNGSSVGNGSTLSTVRLSTPAVTSCSSKSKAITLKWKKNTKVSGYEIKYKTGSSSKTIKVKKKAAVKYVIKKLNKGKRYTVQMRSYKTAGGKTYYSAWSGAKKVVVR